MDDANQFSRTRSKCSVMRTVICHFMIIVIIEGLLVFYTIVNSVDQCVTQGDGAEFGYTSMFRFKVAGLIYGRSKPSKYKKFSQISEAGNITDFAKYHVTIDICDVENGHDNRIREFDDIFYL